MDYGDKIFAESKSDRFKDLIEGLNVITYEFSVLEGRFTYVSRMAETLTGYSQKDWLEAGFWIKHIHPEDREWASRYSKEQTHLLKNHEYEFRFVCINGSVKWFKDISTVSAVESVPVKQVGILVDVTERKKFEHELKESKERYQALVEQQSEMITRWKPDGTYTYVNDVFCSFFGKSKHELLGKTFILPMPPEDLTRFSKFFIRLNKSNPISDFTHRVIMPDGEERWLKWTETAIFDGDNIVEYQTVGRDVTERKNAEEALKESEEKYRRLIENTNVIAWEYDIKNKRYLFVSRQAESILGYPISRWYADFFWYDTLHPDDKDWAKKFSNENVEKGINHEFEYRVIASGGSVKWFKDITSVNKNTGRLHGILIDITERKNIEELSKQNEKQLNHIIENAPIGMAVSDEHGRLLQVNKAFCNITGYDKNELLTMHFDDLTHPHDIDLNFNLFTKPSDGEVSSYETEKKYIKKNGEIVTVHFNVSLMENMPNSSPRQIAQVIDITERKKAELMLKETELRLSSIINNLPNMVFYENHKGIPKIAESVHSILGYTADELTYNKDLFLSLFHPEDRKRVERGKAVWNTVMQKGYHKKEYRLKHKNGNYIWFEDLMYAVNSPEGQYMAGFMIDITERKRAEEKIRENEFIISNLIKNFPNIVIYHTGYDKQFISENVADMLGYAADELNNDHELFTSLIHPDDKKSIEKVFNSWRKNNKDKPGLKTEFRIKRKDGNYIWLEDHVVHIFADDKGKASIAGFLINITDRKIQADKLEESQARLTVLMNNIPNVIFYENTREKQFISPNIYDLLGYTSEDFYSNSQLFDSLIYTEDLNKVVKGSDRWLKADHHNQYKETFRIKTREGKLLWVEDQMFRLTRADGSKYSLGVLIDITDQKMIEEKIAQSLNEKELLLKEIHHRVKNNLQVVSSLLRLQTSYVTDNNTLDILIDSQNRVRSMALVHQKLYQSKDFSQIDFKEYINQLSEQLFNVFRQKNKDIKINISSNDAKMSIDHAIPCGLIINELISNSLKYAFPDNRSGLIDIDVYGSVDDRFVITVKDNGVGFPKGIDFKGTSTLGLQLVNTLVGQIDGTIDMENGIGTKFTLRFANRRNKVRT